MRTATAAETAFLTQTYRNQTVYSKVEVYRGSWIDISNLFGYDWVTSIEYGQALDAPISDAIVKIGRRRGGMHMSPFVSGSPCNVANPTRGLLAPGVEIRISTATMPVNSGTPESSDYHEVFHGYIETVKLSPNDVIELRCLDEGVNLVAGYVEGQVYLADSASATEKKIENFIQAILDGCFSNGWIASAVTLWSINGTGGAEFNGVDSPGANVRTKSNFGEGTGFQMERLPIMDVLQGFADQFGWLLRYKWQESAGAFKLVLYPPERAAPSVQYTFNLRNLYAWDLEYTREHVRNYIEVGYVNSAGSRTYESATDATSITNYGRRYFRFSESASEALIYTSTAAQDLADNLLADLKDPVGIWNLTAPYTWHLEITDYVRVSDSDLVIMDSQQDGAIQSIRHTIDANGARSNIQITGTPKNKTMRAQELLHDWTKGSAKQPPQLSMGTASRRGNLIPNGDFGNIFRR